MVQLHAPTHQLQIVSYSYINMNYSLVRRILSSNMENLNRPLLSKKKKLRNANPVSDTGAVSTKIADWQWPLRFQQWSILVCLSGKGLSFLAVDSNSNRSPTRACLLWWVVYFSPNWITKIKYHSVNQINDLLQSLDKQTQRVLTWLSRAKCQALHLWK